MRVYMNTATSGATIFYTVSSSGYVTPTHNGASATGNTLIFNPNMPVSVSSGVQRFFMAVAYKSGLGDSAFSTFQADNSIN
jgi:hypothetical protein